MGPRNASLAWLLAASLWVPGAASAQSLGQIAGTVTDVTGGALAEATVTLRGPADRVARTDAYGRFMFPGLPAGDYDVVASLSPFLPARRSLRLAAGERATLSFTLSVHVREQTSVTALKTGERDVLEIPSSVSVLTSDGLRSVEARSVEDVAGRAPSVTFSENTGFGQLTIRGIGSTTVFTGTDPSSAAYLDGVYLSRPVMLLTNFLDMERVEVLRGPQGTLYGRNAMGGAVNLITRSPTNDLEVGARVVAGDLDTVRAEARVSGPIVKNRLLGSAAIARGYRNGFVRDIDHPDHPLGGEDLTAARGKLQFVISPRSDLLLSADVSHDDAPPLGYAKVLAVKPGFQVSNPPDLHEVRTSALAEGRNLQYGAAARFTVRLAPDIMLTSLTAFRKLDYELKVDADITELDLTISHVHEIQHQISEELTVSQQRQGLTWIAGLFLLDDADRQPTMVTLGGPRLENHLNPEADAASAAAFGQATLDLTRHVSATAGLRYTRERKTFENSGQLRTLDTPVMVVPSSSYAYTDAISNSAWTPKFGVQLHPGGETLVYASATRGFKSGGFNLTSREPGLGFAPEWVWNYEGGVKTRVANGRVTLSAAAFHTDYQDLQVQTPLRPGVIDISNAAAATIRGVELESAVRIARVRAGGHLAWLDATYDRYNAVGVGGITGDVAGNRLNNAPEWSGRAWIETTFDTGRARAVSLRADSIWQSTVFFSPFNDAVQRQRPYGLLDLSVEFGPKRGPWSIGAYARNLTGVDYITGAIGTAPPAFGGRPGDTRRVGIRFTIARPSGRI